MPVAVLEGVPRRAADAEFVREPAIWHTFGLLALDEDAHNLVCRTHVTIVNHVPQRVKRFRREYCSRLSVCELGCYYCDIMVALLMPGTDIGNRVRRLRESRGLLQKTVAAEAGVGRSWLNQVEMGKRDEPRLEDLAKVAAYFDVSLDYLVTGREPDADRDVVIQGTSEEKAAILRRLSRLPADQLARFERAMADIFGLWDAPADDEAEGESDGQPHGDTPDTTTDTSR